MSYIQTSPYLSGTYHQLGDEFPIKFICRANNVGDNRIRGKSPDDPDDVTYFSDVFNNNVSVDMGSIITMVLIKNKGFEFCWCDTNDGSRTIWRDLTKGVYHKNSSSALTPYDTLIWSGIVDFGSITDIVIDQTIPVFVNFSDMEDFIADVIDNDNYDPTAHNGFNGYDSGEDPEPESPDEKDEISDEDLVEFSGITSSPLFTLATIDNTNLSHLANNLKAGWLANDVGKSVISLKYIKTPSAIPVSTAEPIIMPSGISGEGVNGCVLTRQYNEFDFGRVDIPTYFGNFLDYDPYTSIHIYLPYSGVYQLKANDVVNGSISIKCIIDMLTGDLVYYLTVDTPERESSSVGGTKQTMYQFNGNCGFDQALSAEDYGQKVSGLISSSMSVIGGIMSGNPFATSTGIASGIETAMTQAPAQCGNIGANNGFSGIQYPYLIIRRPRISVPSNYNHIIGRPSMKQATLSSLTGFTKMYDLNLNNITGATDSELTEIEALLKSGVIL